MIHQPLGGFQGQASDFEIHAKEMLLVKQKVNEILAKHTGKTLKKVEQDTDRDNFLNAKEAKAYGIIDEILESFFNASLDNGSKKLQKNVNQLCKQSSFKKSCYNS